MKYDLLTPIPISLFIEIRAFCNMGVCPPVCPPLTDVSRGLESSGEWRCVVGRVVPDMSMERAGLQLRGQAAWPWRCTMTTITRRKLFTQRNCVTSQKTRILNNTAVRTLNRAMFQNSTGYLEIRHEHFNLQHHDVRYCDEVTGWMRRGSYPGKGKWSLLQKTSKPAVKPTQSLS